MFQLSIDLKCIAVLHGASLVVLGSNSSQGEPRSDTYTTRLPRPKQKMGCNPKDSLRRKGKCVDENLVKMLEKKVLSSLREVEKDLLRVRKQKGCRTYISQNFKIFQLTDVK
ncbi:hypothetical protein TNCV_3764891 [Trichonephila clavipes]|nr:hypothetical protein TNCV_3764891 [Trichonephila clavipes]